MAESVNGGGSKLGQSPKELSMEMRLLLAFLLMGAVMWVTPYFFKAQNPTPVKKTAPTESPAAATAPAGTPAEAPPSATADPAATSTTPAVEAKESAAEAPASATSQQS